MRLFLLVVGLGLGTAACGGGLGGGSSWVKQPLDGEEERAQLEEGAVDGSGHARIQSRTIGGAPQERNELAPLGDANGEAHAGGGRVLGTFRNTYYDFPSEGDFQGGVTSLMNSSCQPIAKVPRGFFEAVCVQGSGSLAAGGTVSFAKRDCGCADVCPRTGQKICFEALDRDRYPWGRGAAGRPIMPLRSVAADTTVLPMGTVLYIPELEGAPVVRDGMSIAHDGCFVVEDRGLKVQGEHVDIFTGRPDQTAALNARVPSNRGVTVVVDSPRCARLATRGG